MFDPRILLMFASNVLLLHITLMVNSAITPWSLYFFILGPLLVFPALYPRLSGMMLCLFFTGIWIDVAFHGVFGLFTLFLPICGIVVFQLRIRFRAEHNFHPAILAHVANFIFLIVLTVAEGKGLWGAIGFWKQVVLTSFLSHLCLLVIAPWFFNLQRLLFELCRLDLEPDEYPIL